MSMIAIADGGSVSATMATQHVNSREGCYMAAKQFVGKEKVKQVGDKFTSVTEFSMGDEMDKIYREALCTQDGL